jgi:heat shock protein 90kDa beta
MLTGLLLRFFERVDKVLRRSLGVSETAPTPTDVKPAPPVDPSLPEEDGETDEEGQGSVPPPSSAGSAGFEIPEEWKNQFDIDIEEIDEFGNVVLHDEL